MPLYIARPEFLASDVDVTRQLAEYPLGEKYKHEARRALLEIRSRDERARAIDQWVKVELAPQARVCDWTCGTSVTRTVLLRMSPHQADRMRDQLESVLLFEDRELELIEDQDEGTAADASEAWHLDMVGAAEERLTPPCPDAPGTGIRVAVLDTGVQGDHAELRGRVQQWHRRGWWRRRDFAVGRPCDSHGHGTFTAGLIAGAQVGVAPGADILSVVMLPGGTGWTSEFVCAMEWVGFRDDVNIINISAGLPGTPGDHKGVEGVVADAESLGIWVAAVGNEGANSARCPAYLRSVTSVGAIDAEKRRWPGSGFARYSDWDGQYTVPSFVAPGVNVCSCDAGGGFRRRNGTSSAAPIVCGVAARIQWEHREEIVTKAKMLERVRARCEQLEMDVEEQGDGLVRAGPPRA